MANNFPADPAASKTKQAFALRFPIAVCRARRLWAYAHERRPFFSRAQTLFIVIASLFSRDEKLPPHGVVAAMGQAAQLLVGAFRLAFASVLVR